MERARAQVPQTSPAPPLGTEPHAAEDCPWAGQGRARRWEPERTGRRGAGEHEPGLRAPTLAGSPPRPPARSRGVRGEKAGSPEAWREPGGRARRRAGLRPHPSADSRSAVGPALVPRPVSPAAAARRAGFSSLTRRPGARRPGRGARTGRRTTRSAGVREPRHGAAQVSGLEALVTDIAQGTGFLSSQACG